MYALIGATTLPQPARSSKRYCSEGRIVLFRFLHTSTDPPETWRRGTRSRQLDRETGKDHGVDDDLARFR